MEVHGSLQGEFGKHPGITETTIAFREKCHNPNMAQLIGEWVISCEQCIRESRIDCSLARFPLQNPNEHNTTRRHANWLSGFENIVKAMDVFYRYLFAYPTSNQKTKTVSQVLFNIMKNHAYLPTTFISDRGSSFVPHVITEVASVPGITLRHATTKHAEAIGMLDRSHASMKRALKIGTGEQRSLWHKYVSIAVLNYNTSYHTGIGCEPCCIFHRPTPYNILDIKLGIRPQQAPIPTSWKARDVLDQTQMIYQDVSRNAVQANIRHKACYDKKAKASKLKEADYVYVLQIKADLQGSKIPFREFCWIFPYKLKTCYRITNIWYAKLALTKRKCCIACECITSHPANPYLIYKSRHKSGYAVRKSDSNMMICMLECGSGNKNSRNSTSKMLT